MENAKECAMEECFMIGYTEAVVEVEKHREELVHVR